MNKHDRLKDVKYFEINYKLFVLLFILILIAAIF